MNKLLIAMTFAISSLCVEAKNITLHNNITINNKTEYEAVDYAIKALNEDFMRKFGTTQSTLPAISLKFSIDDQSGEFDQYKITFDKNEINFIGSDELGVIHAIYTFSEDILGIDPFIYFSHLMPDVESQIEINDRTITSKPFTYTHRGFFINDEDLIGGFGLEKLEYGFNLDFMEKIYQTALRLKMTGVIPSTLVLADEPHLELASDMGLYIMQHHAEPLGSVPLFWPTNEPYSWSTNREEFIKFWTEAIERQKGRKVVWTIGFRGFLDRDFWIDDPALSKSATDEDKAKIINEVIQTQYDLIKEITGDQDPLVSGILWGAVRGLYNKGLIKYPPTTMIQFADTGFGVFPESVWGDAAKCELPMGVYQHVSYHNRSGHMRINLLNPDMLCKEMQKAYDHGLTSICVLNVGNMKEKVFGIQQMVNYMNDFDKYKNQKDGEYYTWYVNNKFNSDSEALINSYRDFISNHLEFKGNPVGDEFYSLLTETLIKSIYSHKADISFFKRGLSKETVNQLGNLNNYNEQMNIILTHYANLFNQAASRWEISMQRAYDAQGELNGNKLDFYRTDLIFPTEKMYSLTSMASRMCKGALYFINEDYHKAQMELYAAIQHATRALDVEKRIENMHTGDFKDWYRFDENALTRTIKPYLENLLAVCKDMKYVTLPYDNRNSKTPGIEYKYQPYFDSEYQKELIFMENAK